MDLSDAYRYCARVTRQAGSSFYYGMRLLPTAKRMGMFAIYAWSRVCDDAVDDFEGDAAITRLQHARALYLAAFDPAYIESDNPIVRALGETVRTFKIPPAPFEGLIHGMKMDIDAVRFQTYDELEQYCVYAAGTIGEMCVRVFGYSDEEALVFARDLGIALQLTNILRDIKEDIKRERLYLPDEELRAFGYSLADLQAGRMTSAYYDLMEMQVARAKAYYTRARQLFPLIHHDSVRCLRMLYLVYYELLQQIEDSGFRVFDGRIHVSGSRKLKLMWGALWNASTL